MSEKMVLVSADDLSDWADKLAGHGRPVLRERIAGIAKGPAHTCPVPVSGECGHPGAPVYRNGHPVCYHCGQPTPPGPGERPSSETIRDMTGLVRRLSLGLTGKADEEWAKEVFARCTREMEKPDACCPRKACGHPCKKQPCCHCVKGGEGE